MVPPDLAAEKIGRRTNLPTQRELPSAAWHGNVSRATPYASRHVRFGCVLSTGVAMNHNLDECGMGQPKLAAVLSLRAGKSLALPLWKSDANRLQKVTGAAASVPTRTGPATRVPNRIDV